ncbi:response regulator transcription factor [Defluviitalea phaphyphila]|uniref:response regulator transcription factor n=1 Tax=Defluviitalea phaphyphila TaxID=1473580 RepID=UPI000730727B|nr:response regulator [Defluviitalea phaphyphila]
MESIVKLLIADDEDNIRNGIKTYIELHSKLINKIYTASNGREAIDKIFKYKPQVMLIDVQMPYKNGLVVMKEAKEAGICPKTIILSGYDEFSYAQKALRYGAEDYLLKPCRSTEILAKVENMIKSDNNIDDNSSEYRIDKHGNRFVDIAIEYLNEHYMDNISLKEVAEKVGVTPGYLTTLFAKTIGCSFIEYLNKVRVERACNYFYDNTLKTYEVAYKVGFSDEKYFSRVFKKIKGISPSKFRKSL